MSSLTGKTIAETYKDLLQVSNNNEGVDATLRPVQDGEGTVSCIQISETEIAITGTTTLSGAVNVSGTLTATDITGVGTGITGISYTQLADKPVNISEFVNDSGYLLPGQGGSWTPSSDGLNVSFSSGDVTIGALATDNNQLKIEGHDVAKIELHTKSDSYTNKILSQAKKIVIGGDTDNVQIDQENKVLDIFGTKRSNFDTSGRFTVGANDWKSLLHVLESSIGTLSNVSHNASAEGLVVSGATYIVIPVRIPIDPNATYAVTARLKKLVDGGTTYIGVDTLKSDTTSLKTDTMNSYNYGTAFAKELEISDGVVTYTGTYKGFNASSEDDKNKFDPGGELFDVVMICNYTGTGLGTGETLIESVEVEKISHDHGAIYSGTVTADDFVKSDGTPVGGTDIWTENGSDIHYSTGNVGVGTTTPTSYDGESHNLVVYDASHSGITIATADTTARGNLRFADGTGGTNAYAGAVEYDHNSDRLSLRAGTVTTMNIIDDKVGIGAVSPVVKLDIESSGQVLRGYRKTTSSWHDLFTLNSDVDGTNTNVFKIEADGTVLTEGNVGIGTDSPDRNLTVAGNFRLEKTEVDGGHPALDFTSGGGADHPELNIYDKDGNAGAFILKGGNVGIGTGTPHGPLEILSGGAGHVDQLFLTNNNGAVGDSAGIVFSQAPATHHYAGIRGIFSDISAAAEDAELALYTSDAGTYAEKVRIDNTGNVGIGTDTPSNKLEVKLDTNKNIAFKGDMGEIGSVAGIVAYDDSDQLNSVGLRGTDLRFANANSEVMRIDSNGNVGIGTTNPSEKIEVAGNLHVDGDISYTGTTTVINAQSLVVEDKNVILGEVTTPTDITGDGGGMILRAASDKTLTWDKDSDAWVSNTNLGVLGNRVKLYNSTGASEFIARTSANSIAGVTSESPSGDWFSGVGKIEQDGFDIYDNSAAASRIHIDPDGNVGIGVENPDTELHVAGTIKNSGDTFTSGDTLTQRVFINSHNDYPLIYFRDSSNTTLGWLGMRENDSSQLSFPVGQDFNIYAYDNVNSVSRKAISISDDGVKTDFKVEDGSISAFGTAAGSGRVCMQIAGGSEWELYPKTEHFGIFNRTFGAYALKIGNTNNVRIGSDAPNSYKLQVDGDTNISGDLTTENLTATGGITSSTQVRAKQNDTNLLPVYEWYDAGEGVGSVPSFDGITGSRREWTEDFPTGRRELVWVDDPNPANGDTRGGGWNGGKIAVDHTKMYRSVVFFKFTHLHAAGEDMDPNTPGTQRAGLFYHGAYCYNSAGTKIGLLGSFSGNSDTNPYFAPGFHRDHGLESNRWYMSVGYIHPSNATSMPHTSSGGVFDVITGENVRGYGDWKMPSDCTDLNHRTYNYYDYSTDNTSYFARPRFEECNGTEPSLEQLLSIADEVGSTASGRTGGYIGKHNFPGQVAIGKEVTDIENSAKLDVKKTVDVEHSQEKSDPIIRAEYNYVSGSSTNGNSLDISSYGTTWGTSDGMDIAAGSGKLSLSTGGRWDDHRTGITINNSGDVGIGTRDPQGNISSDNALHISDSSVAEIRLSSAINFSIYTGSQAFVIRDVGRSKDKISINNASQYIGINTSSPSCPVHIRGLTQAEDIQDGDPYLDLLVESPDNSGGIGIDAKGGNQSHLRFLSDGEMKWQWRVPAQFSDSSSLGYPNAETFRAYSWDVGKDVLVLGQISDNHLSTGGSSGYGGLGINTTPVHALDVVGDAHISGTLTASEVITNTQTNLNIIDKEINAAAGATTESAMHLGGIKLGTGSEQKTWIYDKDISTNGSWVSNTSIKCNDKLVVTDGSGPDDWLFPIDLTRSSGETNDGSNFWTTGGSPVIGMKNLQATDGNILGGLEFEGDNWYAGSIYCKSSSHANRQAALRFATRGGNNNYADRMTITPTGNVGIGTTSPNANVEITSAGTTRLYVTPGSSSTDASIELGPESNNGTEGFRIRYDNDVGDTYIENMWTASSGAKNDAAIRFRTQAVSGNNGSDQTDALTITHIGNVGIGTTSPAKKLHVYETDINEEAYFRLQHSGARNSSLNISNSISDWSWVASGSSDKLFLYESGVGERVSFPAGGGLEIPDILDAGETNFTIKSNYVNLGNSNGANRYSDTSGDGGITFHTSDHRSAMTMSNNANVGNVNGTSGGWSNIYINKIGPADDFNHSGNRFIQFGTDAEQLWAFSSGAAEAGKKDLVINRISATGNLLIPKGKVGIATTEPITDFQVGETSKESDTIVRVAAGDLYKAGVECIGSAQGTGYVYVGQSSYYGGGMLYNGDGNPAFVNGESSDHIGFFRRISNVNHEVFSYSYSSDNVMFNGEISAVGVSSTVSGGYCAQFSKTDNAPAIRFKGISGAHALNWTAGVSAINSTSNRFSIQRIDDANGFTDEPLTILSNGDVGIGTTNPKAKLSLPTNGGDHNGTTNQLPIAHWSDGISMGDDANSYGFNLWHDNYNRTTTYFDSVYDHDDSLIKFRTKTTGTVVDALTIKGNGNVGIGTTEPNYTLEVKKDVDSWVSRIYNTGSDVHANGLLVRTDATAAHGTTAFGVYADGEHKFAVKSSGAVGIGTTSPTAMLDINGDGNDEFLHARQGNTTAFIIDKDRNVGIGKDNPNHKLEVEGTVDAHGFSVNDTAGASGSFTSSDGKTVTVTNGLITSIV